MMSIQLKRRFNSNAWARLSKSMRDPRVSGQWLALKVWRRLQRKAASQEKRFSVPSATLVIRGLRHSSASCVPWAFVSLWP